MFSAQFQILECMQMHTFMRCIDLFFYTFSYMKLSKLMNQISFINSYSFLTLLFFFILDDYPLLIIISFIE